MRKKTATATVALLAAALMLSDYSALARDGGIAKVSAESGRQTSGSEDTTCSSRRVGAKEWVCFHRPDGEAVYIRVDQIVFVTGAAAGAAMRARSKIQLLNGYYDVRESVDEVMQLLVSGTVFAGYR
jgi:hypothetical protein